MADVGDHGRCVTIRRTYTNRRSDELNNLNIKNKQATGQVHHGVPQTIHGALPANRHAEGLNRPASEMLAGGPIREEHNGDKNLRKLLEEKVMERAKRKANNKRKEELQRLDTCRPPLLGSHHQQRPFLRKLQHLHQLRGRPRVRQCSPLASHDRRKKMQNF